MIKQLLSGAFILSALFVKAQSFNATFDFASTTSLTGVTDPTTPPSATGVTFGAFTAVGTGTASSASGRFSFNSWGLGAQNGTNTPTSYTGAIDPGKYYEVTVTPTGGYNLSLSSITFSVQRSSTGIRNYAVRSSADSYSANLVASVGTSTNLSVINTNEFFWNLDALTSAQGGSSISLATLSDFTNFTSPITFRFYAWNAEQGSGTFSIDNVVFNGEASVTTKLGSVNFDMNSNFNVYPNPSNDGVVYIENRNAMEITKIEVLDVLGNIVSTNNPKTETRVKINLSEMPNGNYFVRMYSGNMISTKKIAVVK